MSQMDQQTEVDFNTKKTESEWLVTSDRFWLTITPKLFEYLGWVALLAGVTYVQRKTGSYWLLLFLFFCTTSMMFYFFALFAKIKFKGFLTNKPNVQRFISISLSTALALGANYLATVSINVLASTYH